MQFEKSLASTMYVRSRQLSTVISNDAEHNHKK